jgi:hypothetical protein
VGSPLTTGRVYAIGRLEPQFPSLDIEKEFAQAAAGGEDGLAEAALLRAVLTAPDNRYLARQMCWVFTAQGVEAFALWPREEADVGRLVELLPGRDAETMLHVVIGRTVSAPGWIDNPCAESGLPIVVADQLFAFTLDEFVDQIVTDLAAADGGGGGEKGGVAAQDKAVREQHTAVTREVFHWLTRRSDNAGFTNEHRALNYLALRFPPAYRAAMQAYGGGKTLTAVHAHHSHARDRGLVSVQFTFRDRRSEIIERYECTVDVTGFPFLVSGLQPTYG